jgi:hypothetical protein
MLSGGSSLPRAYAYGFGMGHVLCRHSLRALWASFLAYNVGRAIWALICGNRLGGQLCLAQNHGLWEGFLAPITPNARQASFANEMPSVDRSTFHSGEELTRVQPGGAYTS